MKISSTSQRLKEIMNEKKLKQIDVLNKIQPLCNKYNIKMGSNDLSQYVTGKVEPSQKKLSVLAEVLDVDEVWLMGYDVSSERKKTLSKEDYIVIPRDIKNHWKKGEIIQVADLLNELEKSYALMQKLKKQEEILNSIQKKLNDNTEDS